MGCLKLVGIRCKRTAAEELPATDEKRLAGGLKLEKDMATWLVPTFQKVVHVSARI